MRGWGERGTTKTMFSAAVKARNSRSQRAFAFALARSVRKERSPLAFARSDCRSATRLPRGGAFLLVVLERTITCVKFFSSHAIFFFTKKNTRSCDSKMIFP